MVSDALNCTADIFLYGPKYENIYCPFSKDFACYDFKIDVHATKPGIYSVQIAHSSGKYCKNAINIAILCAELSSIDV